MNNNQLRSALVEEIGVDHSTQSEFRTHMARRARQRSTVKRRRIAVVGTATTVAAAIGAVFVIGGQVTSPQNANPAHAAAGSNSSGASASLPPRPSSSSSVTGIAEPSISQTTISNSAVSAENAAVQSCISFGLQNPVAPDGTVDPTQVASIASSCAASFHAELPGSAHWVVTDGQGVSDYLRSGQPPVDAEDVILVRVQAQIPPPHGTTRPLATWLLTIPLKPSRVVTVYFLDNPVPSTDAMRRLGTVHQASITAAATSSSTTAAATSTK